MVSTRKHYRKGFFRKLWNYKYVRYLTALILILGAVMILWLPASYFDSGRSLSVFSFFGVDDYIYSTGMTRSIMHLIHLDFKTAWFYNPIGFLVLPLLFLLWLKALLACFDKKIIKWF
jgi:hypothetical protein